MVRSDCGGGAIASNCPSPRFILYHNPTVRVLETAKLLTACICVSFTVIFCCPCGGGRRWRQSRDLSVDHPRVFQSKVGQQTAKWSSSDRSGQSRGVARAKCACSGVVVAVVWRRCGD